MAGRTASGRNAGRPRARHLNRRRLLGASAAVTAALLAACGTKNKGTGTASSGTLSSAGKARYGGALHVPIAQDPYDFDYSLNASGPPNGQLSGLPYETLLSFKVGPKIPYSEIDIGPGLAKSWETPDPDTYIFHLQPGLSFANLAPVNGRAVTSDDVKWSFQYFSRTGPFKDAKLKPGRYSGLYQGMTSIDTPDASTAAVHFSKPFAPFLTYNCIDALEIVAHEIFDQDGNFSNRVVGTGPYQLDVASTQKGARWVFKKNPTYWQKGMPYMDEVDCLVLPDDASTYAALQTKQIDILLPIGGSTDLTVIPTIKKNNLSATVQEYATPGTEGIYVNQRRPPFDDVRMRQAVSLAIDRDQFDKTFANGLGGWALPESLPDEFTQAEVKQILKTDIAQAKQLVSAAGHSNGVDAEFLIRGQGEVPIAEVELLQAQLKNAGINMSIKTVDGASGTQQLHDGNFQLTVGGHGISGDLDQRFSNYYSTSASNFIGVKDPKLDALIDAERQEPDPTKREQRLRDVTRYMAANWISFALYRPIGYTFSQSYVKNYFDHWQVTGWNAGTVWLDK